MKTFNGICGVCLQHWWLIGQMNFMNWLVKVACNSWIEKERIMIMMILVIMSLIKRTQLTVAQSIVQRRSHRSHLHFTALQTISDKIVITWLYGDITGSPVTSDIYKRRLFNGHIKMPLSSRETPKALWIAPVTKERSPIFWARLGHLKKAHWLNALLHCIQLKQKEQDQSILTNYGSPDLQINLCNLSQFRTSSNSLRREYRSGLHSRWIWHFRVLCLSWSS